MAPTRSLALVAVVCSTALLAISDVASGQLFQSRVSYGTGSYRGAVVVARLDADARLDLAVASGNPAVELARPDERGNQVPSGAYFLGLEAGRHAEGRKPAAGEAGRAAKEGAAGPWQQPILLDSFGHSAV